MILGPKQTLLATGTFVGAAAAKSITVLGATGSNFYSTTQTGAIFCGAYGLVGVQFRAWVTGVTGVPTILFSAPYANWDGAAQSAPAAAQAYTGFQFASAATLTTALTAATAAPITAYIDVGGTGPCLPVGVPNLYFSVTMAGSGNITSLNIEARGMYIGDGTNPNGQAARVDQLGPSGLIAGSLW